MSYDFTKTAEFFGQWDSPKGVADNLKTAALELSITDSGVLEEKILAMQREVLTACQILDTIKEVND